MSDYLKPLKRFAAMPTLGDIRAHARDIARRVNYYLDDKRSLLAHAKQALKGPGGIQEALPLYDKAIAEANAIDQVKIKAELDTVSCRLQTERDQKTRRVLMRIKANLELLQRMPGFALANKGLAEKHNGLAQGEKDLEAAKALDPKMATDERYLRKLHNVEIDLAAAHRRLDYLRFGWESCN
jgi:hypothetical protein